MKNFGCLILIVIAALVLLAACDAQSRVTGHVYDSNGRPLANATVKFEVVDISGRFVLWVPHGPMKVSLRLTVIKEGYVTFTKDLTSNEAQRMREENYEQSVTLRKEIKE
jgi:hypothetical protein